MGGGSGRVSHNQSCTVSRASVYGERVKLGCHQPTIPFLAGLDSIRLLGPVRYRFMQTGENVVGPLCYSFLGNC